MLSLNLSRWEKIGLVLAILFLLFTRLYRVDVIPATLTHDETVYAIQARSFVLSGKSLDHTQGFFNLTPNHVMYAGLPAQVMALGFLVTDHPFIATHLVSILMGLSLPFLLAWLTWNVWRRRNIAKATFLVFVLSPIFWQMSRISYDVFYSIWFYVMGGVLFTRQNWRAVLASIPFFFIGFFQYQGFKLLLVPWAGLLLMLMISLANISLKPKKLLVLLKKYRWQLLVLLFCLGLTLYYGLVMLPGQPVSTRLSDTIFTDPDYLSEGVNIERRLSLDNPFMRLVSNKGTAMLDFVLNRLIGVFNPNLLLLLIEPAVSGFSVWTHGVFYWAEILLFFVGLAGLAAKKKTRWSAVILLLGVLTLCYPAIINTGSEWYLLRSMFSYLLMTLAAAWGVVYLFKEKWLAGAVAVLYLVNVLHFSYHYWYRYPIISLDWGNFDERVLARYIDLTQKQYPETKITVYGPESEYDFWSYLLYTKRLNRETADEIAAEAAGHEPYLDSDTDYTLGNVTFSSFCAPDDPQKAIKEGDEDEIIIIRRFHKRCPLTEEELAEKEAETARSAVEANSGGKPAKAEPILSISAVLDSGERMEIFGDQICAPHSTTYIDVNNLKQLELEDQSREKFCQLWIKNLRLVR